MSPPNSGPGAPGHSPKSNEVPSFQVLVPDLFKKLAREYGDLNEDLLDTSLGDGTLALEFKDGAKFIVSRQGATSQIWLAAGARAWHYNYSAGDGAWVDDRDGHLLLVRLREIVTKKLAELETK